MTKVVPPIKQIIPTPAAKLDEDGNEFAGVKSVLLMAPLGTYTSWNPVASGPLQGNEGSLAASYVPFAVTRAERTAAGDPRPSVEERYGSQEGYNCVVRHAGKDRVAKRFLLQEDADRLIAHAAASPSCRATPTIALPSGSARSSRAMTTATRITTTATETATTIATMVITSSTSGPT